MRKRTLIALLLVFAIIISGMLIACQDKCKEHVDENGDFICDKCNADLRTNDPDTPQPQPNKVLYSISLKTMAGAPISNVTAFIYDADATDVMKGHMVTDANGMASREMTEGRYFIELGTIEGYVTAEKYYFNANRVANIVLETKVVAGEHRNYALGSVMKDFSVDLVGGGTFKLSEALETYNAVLLNFFYTTCSPCIGEFPYLNEAAGMYKDKVAVICVDTNNETFAKVEDFYNERNLTNLNMGIHDIGLFAAFNTAGYPTSVMIDRYGVICLIEVGGMPYLYPFTAMFDYFGADNYTQKLFTSVEELTPKEKPAQLGYVQAPSAEVAEVMNGANMADDTRYYPETELADSEYYWPFVKGEKEGVECMVSSNFHSNLKYNTTAVMNVDVTLQEGQALSLDYFCSSEMGADNFYVMVDDEVIFWTSGECEEWERCYPYVAIKDGTYKISFVYNKDSSNDVGDDCVYISNLNIVSVSSIDKETFIPRNAVSEPLPYNDGYQNYATVVYNETDGYYHVNEKDGPLLIANLMNYVLDDKTEEATSLYLYVYEQYALNPSSAAGSLYDRFVKYCSYASNSEIYGYCTVNEALKTYLVALNELYKGGVLDETENGWLRFCKYYDAYGTDAQVSDPIIGLAPFSAYQSILNAEVGLEEYPNSVTYTKVMIPRGKYFRFTSEEGGVYRIISTGDVAAEGWIYDENNRIVLEASDYERLTDTNNDGEYTQIEYGSNNVCMVYYFEPGKEYYIDIAFNDINATGTINFKIERLGDTYTMFRYASPAVFTFYVDPVTGEIPTDKGEEVYTIIAGGKSPVYNSEDGYYYIGKSKLYVDITLPIITGFLGDRSIQEIVEMGYFDFTKYVFTKEDGSQEFRVGADENGEPLKDKDNKDLILAVKDAEGNTTKIRDYTDDIKEYIENKMITSDGVFGSEATLASGCIAVDKDLAVMLQYLVNKTSFRGVTDAWTKLCYYFEYLGPQTEEAEA